jgi:formate hydrogenlyase subunit 3/multisubunit Na+/H+ antiporter MnhD subunit
MNPSLLIALPLLISFTIPLFAKLHKKLPNILVLISTLINVLITFSLFNTVMSEPLVIKLGNWNIPYGINLYVDKLALISLIIISVLTFLIAVFNLRNIGELDQSKFNTMFLLAFAGINGIILYW